MPAISAGNTGCAPGRDTGRGEASDRLKRVCGAAPLALPLFLYLALPTRNFYWDGIAAALQIERQEPPVSLLYPNHLLYTLLGSWLYGAAGFSGLHARALYLMQALNGILAGLCVVLVYKMLRLQGIPACSSIAGALAFGFSATWWRFAADANAYVPAIFLTLAAYILPGRSRHPALAGLVHAGAMLFHQLAIFFLPVALIRLRKNRPARAAYALAALAPVAVAYPAAYRAVSPGGTIRGFLAWVTQHSSDSVFSVRLPSNALLTLRGTLRLFFGGRVGDFVGDPLSVAAALALLAVSAVFLAFCWRRLRFVRLSRPPLDLAAWAAIYAAFLFFWMPQNTFYRLFYLAPLVAIAILSLRDTPRIRTAGMLFVALLFLWNFVFVVYPQSRVRFNAPMRFAIAQRNTWPPGSPIVFHRFHPDLWTICYFNLQAVWMGLERANVPKLEQDLNYAREEGKPLWLEATAYDLVSASAPGRSWLALHERPAESVSFRDGRHEFRFHAMR